MNWPQFNDYNADKCMSLLIIMQSCIKLRLKEENKVNYKAICVFSWVQDEDYFEISNLKFQDKYKNKHYRNCNFNRLESSFYLNGSYEKQLV